MSWPFTYGTTFKNVDPPFFFQYIRSCRPSVEGGKRVLRRQDRDKPAPLISIITVVFNEAQSLSRTIKSVLSQNYKNFEYIIIDGGSTDTTLEIVRNNDAQIDYWISEKDNGIADAFNKGIVYSRGLWIQFLNAGDTFVDDDALNKVIPLLCDDEFIISSFARFRTRTLPDKRVSNEDPLTARSMISHQASLVRRCVFEVVGLFRPEFTIRMDYEFWLRCLKKYKLYFSNTVLVNYCAGASGRSIRTFTYEGMLANAYHVKYCWHLNVILFCKYLIKKYILGYP